LGIHFKRLLLSEEGGPVHRVPGRRQGRSGSDAIIHVDESRLAGRRSTPIKISTILNRQAHFLQSK
jgi:hypothetical protein